MMTRGFITAITYAALTAAAAAADGLNHPTTRAPSTVVIESLPLPVLLAVAVRASRGGRRRHGALPLGVAVVALGAGIVGTGGRHADADLFAVGSFVVANLALAVAYLSVIAAGRSGRHAWSIAVLLALPTVACVFGLVSLMSLGGTSGKACGVDACAFAGIGLAIAVGFTVECTLLVALASGFGAGWRPGSGVVLYGVGANLVLSVAPQWSQYQGVMGVALGYAGLWLAVWPWIRPLPAAAPPA